MKVLYENFDYGTDLLVVEVKSYEVIEYLGVKPDEIAPKTPEYTVLVEMTKEIGDVIKIRIIDIEGTAKEQEIDITKDALNPFVDILLKRSNEYWTKKSQEMIACERF